MRFTETGIIGAMVIDPNPHQDDRGRFMRAWCRQEFAEHGLEFLPVQANMGFSLHKGTVRGMHFQDAPSSRRSWSAAPEEASSTWFLICGGNLRHIVDGMERN